MLRKRLAGVAISAIGRSSPFASLVRLLEAVDPRRSDILAVLTYHRVDEPGRNPMLYPGLLSASPTAFDAQLRFLAGRYRCLSLGDVLDARESHRRLPPRSLLLTVDDAYRDFGEYTWPIARRHGAPLTLFVPTAYPDSGLPGFWWDRTHAALAAADRPVIVRTPAGRLDLRTASGRRAAFRRVHALVRSLPHEEGMALVDELVKQLDGPQLTNSTLTWAELRQLAADGASLAAHSRTHPRLDRVDRDRAMAEIVGSVEDVRRHVGSALPAFAYPSGDYDETALELAGTAGIRAAFTTRRGLNDLRRGDWLRLRRINVGGRSSLPIVRAQLLTAFAPVTAR